MRATVTTAATHAAGRCAGLICRGRLSRAAHAARHSTEAVAVVVVAAKRFSSLGRRSSALACQVGRLFIACSRTPSINRVGCPSETLSSPPTRRVTRRLKHVATSGGRVVRDAATIGPVLV